MFHPASFVKAKNTESSFSVDPPGYWLYLQRDADVEFLYFGVPGDHHASIPLRIFRVKSGIPGSRPTPVPQYIGRRYWVITDSSPSDNPETAPYFLTIDVPVSEGPPYGPVPYPECNGQCDWVLPGAFGLHGVNGLEEKLQAGDPGSSGCIRHADRDITMLFHLLKPSIGEIRYYIGSGIKESSFPI